MCDPSCPTIQISISNIQWASSLPPPCQCHRRQSVSRYATPHPIRIFEQLPPPSLLLLRPPRLSHANGQCPDNDNSNLVHLFRVPRPHPFIYLCAPGHPLTPHSLDPFQLGLMHRSARPVHAENPSDTFSFLGRHA